MSDKPRDRRMFIDLISSGEILSGLTSPADRRNLEMFCGDYDKLQTKLNLQAEAIKKILAEVKINTDKDFYEHLNSKVDEILKVKDD